ncbi:hypothetical protein FQ775_01985 [Nitratireductor mangrovi]|uniref:Uncharacterized protein n=1 Tax=Nitratireductor mangrovi TaxID=2599600 RepID=A0A5B8L6U9_9HYPH|nr:hypothetical protein [Nitratireductor mangrovi]QDZ03168.1 hypothetical protein FQ775_01985 [Nitratireductor mangrovi]
MSRDSEAAGGATAAKPGISILGRRIPLPRSRPLRITIGTLLVLLGLFFGFLPVLGYWMVPVGLMVLSYDIPVVRRLRRRIAVWWSRRKQRRTDTAEREESSRRGF